MRRHLLTVELDRDMDLTSLSSRRVQIEAIASNRYRVTPPAQAVQVRGSQLRCALRPAPRSTACMVRRQRQPPYWLFHP